MQFKLKVTCIRDEFIKGVNDFVVDVYCSYSLFMEDFNNNTQPFYSFTLQDNTKIAVNKSIIKSLEILKE